MGNRRTLGQIKDTERFMDLESWDDLYGYCMKCGHIGALDRDHLERKYGKGTKVQSLTSRLKCLACKNAEYNMIGAKNKLRD